MPSEIIPSLDLAPSVPSRIVTITAADVTKGTPQAGKTVTFKLRGDLRVPADGAIISAGSVTLTLDAQGKGRVRLPCYTSHTRADSADGEWYLEVSKSWVGQADLIRVPTGTGTIALAAIEPVRELPLHAAPAWLLTGAGVEVVEGTSWGATVTVRGGVATFRFTVPRGATVDSVIPTTRGQVQAGADLNDYTSSSQAGAYGILATAVGNYRNAPTIDHGGVFELYRGTGNNFSILQRITTQNGMWFREAVDTTQNWWGEWQRVATQDDILSTAASLSPTTIAYSESVDGRTTFVHGDPNHLMDDHGIASITKMMTVWLSRRHLTDAELDTTVTVLQEDMYAGTTINVGDVVSYRELFYVTMVASNSNAPRVLARVIGKKIDPNAAAPLNRFVEEMGAEAARLGYKGAHFTRPITAARMSARHVMDLFRRFIADPQLRPTVAAVTHDLKIVGGPNPRTTRISHTIQPAGPVPFPEFLAGKTGTAGGRQHVVTTWRHPDGSDHFTVILNALDSISYHRYRELRKVIEATGAETAPVPGAGARPLEFASKDVQETVEMGRLSEESLNATIVERGRAAMVRSDLTSSIDLNTFIEPAQVGAYTLRRGATNAPPMDTSGVFEFWRGTATVGSLQRVTTSTAAWWREYRDAALGWGDWIQVPTSEAIPPMVAAALAADDAPAQAAAAAVAQAVQDEGGVQDPVIAAAINDTASDTRQAIRDAAMPREGGTLAGDLHLQTPPNERSNRIILEAWERSNNNNNRAGDVMELRWRTPYAKAFIGWWDYTDPTNPRMKAWMGAHDEQNNPNPDAQPHRHWSIEVTDESGQMQTRLAVPYDKNHTNITTSSADFTVGWGTLRVANGPLQFTTGTDGKPEEQRWTFETIDEGARNFRIRGHRNNGTANTIMRFDRETGFITFGSNNVAERLLHVRVPAEAAVIEGTASSNTGLVLIRHNAANRRVLQTEVSGDAVSRFSLEANGAMAWGDGGSRPLTLNPILDQGISGRRFLFGGADVEVSDPARSRGLILTDRTTGARRRVYLDNGQLTLEAA